MKSEQWPSWRNYSNLRPYHHLPHLGDHQDSHSWFAFTKSSLGWPFSLLADPGSSQSYLPLHSCSSHSSPEIFSAETTLWSLHVQSSATVTALNLSGLDFDQRRQAPFLSWISLCQSFGLLSVTEEQSGHSVGHSLLIGWTPRCSHRHWRNSIATDRYQKIVAVFQTHYFVNLNFDWRKKMSHYLHYGWKSCDYCLFYWYLC